MDSLIKNNNHHTLLYYLESIRNVQNNNQQQYYENQYYKDDFENDEGTLLKTVRFEHQQQAQDLSPPSGVNSKSSINDLPRQTGAFYRVLHMRGLDTNMKLDLSPIRIYI